MLACCGVKHNIDAPPPLVFLNKPAKKWFCWFIFFWQLFYPKQINMQSFIEKALVLSSFNSTIKKILFLQLLFKNVKFPKLKIFGNFYNSFFFLLLLLLLFAKFKKLNISAIPKEIILIFFSEYSCNIYLSLIKNKFWSNPQENLKNIT